MFWEEFMENATILTPDGEVRTAPASYFRFGYDYSISHDTRGPGSGRQPQARAHAADRTPRVMRENLEWRDNSHPDLWLFPCAGSIFKKIQGIGAGRLIDECGLKGQVHGAAGIFYRHANIIVNHGGATAAEVSR